MTSTKRSTVIAVALAAFVVVGGFLGCGGEREAEQGGAPGVEGTRVSGTASAVTVTYYYLPG